MSQVTALSGSITTHVEKEEVRQRPLDFRLIMRLLSYTRPYAAMRNWLLVMVVIRSVQLPALTWIVATVIKVRFPRRMPPA